MPADDTVKKVIEEVLLESNKRKGTVHPSPSQQATISASPTINPGNPNPSALPLHPQVEFKTASDAQYASKYMRLSQGLASKDLKINPNATTNTTSTNATFTPSSIKISHAAKSQATAGEEKNLPSKKSKKSMGDSTVTLGLSAFVGIKSILVQLQQTQQYKDADIRSLNDSTKERNQKPSDTSQYNVGKGNTSKAGAGGGHTLGTASKTHSETSTNTGNTNKSYQSQSAGIKSQTSANNMGNPNKNVTNSTTGNSNRTNVGAGGKAQNLNNAAGNKYKQRNSNAIGKSQMSNQNNAAASGGNKNKKLIDKFEKDGLTADSKNIENSKNKNKKESALSGVSHVQIEIIRKQEQEPERYSIIGHSGNTLFYARDDTKKSKRKYCGADRPFLVTILSPDDDEEILTIERKCNCLLCFWGGNTWGSKVVIKSSLTGVILGEITQQFSLRTSKFAIKDDENSGGEIIMKIEGTNCGHIWPCIPHWQDHEEFKVFTLSSFIHYQNQNNFVGTIMDYGRRGQKNTMEGGSELYGMLVPPELSPRLKAVLLGAIFNIAFTVFQNNRPLNAVCRTVSIFTVLILLVIIIIVACSA